MRMTWPSPSERLEQLERLDRWCATAPRWKVNASSILLGVLLAVPPVVLNLWLLPQDRACVADFGRVLCVDLRSGELTVSE